MFGRIWLALMNPVEMFAQITTCRIRVDKDGPDHIRTVVISTWGRAFEMVSVKDTGAIKYRELPSLKKDNIVQ